MISVIRTLLSILFEASRHEKLAFYFMLTFIILFAFIDAIFILAIAPFTAAILNGTTSEFAANLKAYIDIDVSLGQIVIAFLCFIAVTTLGRLYSIFYPIKVIQIFRSALTMKLALRFLHTTRHDKSRVPGDAFLKLITSEIDQTMSSVVQPIINIFVSIIFSVVIVIVVFLYDPFATIISFSAIVGVYSIIRTFQKKLQKKWGILRLDLNRQRYNLVNEIYADNVNILLSNRHKDILHRLETVITNYSSTLSKNYALNRFPKIVIEAAMLITFISFVFVQLDSSDQKFFEMIILYFFVAYRLLPHFQSINQNIGEQTFGLASIEAIIHEISKTKELEHYGSNKLNNISKICIKDVEIPFIANGRRLSFELERGKVYALVGHSGIGKSALIERLIGLHRIGSGDVIFQNGRNIANNLKISYMPQVNFIDPSTTPRRYYEEQLQPDELEQCCLFASKMGIGNLLDTKIGDLSGGQLQRCVLAKVLSVAADFVILDEPTSALDGCATKSVFNIIDTEKRNKIFVIITHAPEQMSVKAEIIKL